ncbi:MAG TPA: hypothetical protein G4O16_05205 [Dehalococcoidia bacterium]|nr:hypothetical protein [Dehalococcoidia bacterium]
MKTSNLCAVETKSQKIRHSSLERMDAIACGVRARFEESTGYSKKILETTIRIAKALGVPEQEINRWTANRSNHGASEAERLKEIKNLLQKYYGNSLGITA